MQFPYYNERRQVIPLGEYVQSDWRLKQVTVIPQHGKFRITIILEDGKEEADIVEAEKNPQRICAIDLGVKNFAAMSNNIGKPAMLFKGGVVINANHHCTKYFGKNQSAQARSAAQKSGNAQTSGTAQTSDTTETPEMTKQMKNLLNKRANILSDYIHKTSKLIINWCKENQIGHLSICANGKGFCLRFRKNPIRLKPVFWIMTSFRSTIPPANKRKSFQGTEIIDCIQPKAAEASMLILTEVQISDVKHSLNNLRQITVTFCQGLLLFGILITICQSIQNTAPTGISAL